MSESHAAAVRSALNRADLAAARHRTALARMLGSSENEVLALQYIARSGRLTATQLATRLGLTSGGVTALVHRLERAGHVLREPHPVDRRSSLLRLSAGAESQLGELLSPLAAVIDVLTSGLAEDQQDCISALLTDVADATEREADALASRAAEAESQELSVPVPGLWS